MQLTLEQKRAFIERGYVRVPNAVSRDLINAALHAINHSLGEGINPADLEAGANRCAVS